MSDVWGFRDLVPERAANLQPLGFTERQARFLVTVMLHSGVFLERQYCRFAGITHGQKTHDFIERLVGRGFAREVRPGALHEGVSIRSTTSVSTPWLDKPTTATVVGHRWAGWLSG